MSEKYPNNPEGSSEVPSNQEARPSASMPIIDDGSPEYFERTLEAENLPEEEILQAAADSLVSSPLTAESHFKSLCPDGFYSYFNTAERRESVTEQLRPISETEEMAVLIEFRNWLTRRHGMEFLNERTHPEWMVLSGSTTEDIIDLMAITNKEKNSNARFGAITPTYPDWIRVTNEKYDGRLVAVPMHDTENGWQLDMEKLEKSLKDMDVLFLCNPNNPTGYIFSEEELRKIVQACKENDVKIISDEVFGDKSAGEKKHTPLINMAHEEDYTEGVAMLYGTGKSFGTGAFPCSIAIIPDKKTREAFTNRENAIKPSGQAAMAALDCMQQSDKYVDTLNQVLKENIEYAATVLNRLGFKTNQSDGPFIMAVCLSESEDDDQIEEDVEKEIALFKQAGIGMNDCARYGKKGYGRITFCCPHALVRSQFDELERLCS